MSLRPVVPKKGMTGGIHHTLWCYTKELFILNDFDLVSLASLQLLTVVGAGFPMGYRLYERNRFVSNKERTNLYFVPTEYLPAE